MRRTLSDVRWVSLLFLGVVLLAYGIPIRWFGLYGDDWIYLWNYHQFGAGNFVEFVAADRPFSAWLYVLSAGLFGEQVWLYHILLLALRWLSAVLFWWIVRIVWPDKTRQAVWAALLFALYPGFRQQPIAVQFILHFSVLNLFFLSVAAMLLAAKQPQRFWIWTGLSVVTALSIFSLEYYAGLELLRPVLLWLVVRERAPGWKKRAGMVLRGWLPSLVVLVGFAVWRVFVFSFPTYGPNFIYQFRDAPTQAARQLVGRMIADWKAVSYGAWRQILSTPVDRADLLFYMVLVLAGFALTFYFLSRQYEEEAVTLHWKEWPVSGLGVGMFALLVAGLPFWVTLLPLDLAFPWDRATLPFMLGVSLLLAGGVDLMIRPRFQALLLSALVAMAIGSQFQNALVYRGEWRELQNYFWQLVWRAPALEPGTILISDDIPLWRYSDNDLTPLVNWIYAPDQSSTRQEYKYFDLSTREVSVLPGLEKGLTVSHSYRNTTFKSTTSDILALYYNPPGCLRVLAPDDFINENAPYRLEEAVHLSNLAQIALAAQGEAQPPRVLGSEPPHEWCYFFEKADLARQRGDWPTVARLGEDAFEAGFVAGNSLEYLPFIEGYAQLGQWEQARSLSETVREQKQHRPALCGAWARIAGRVHSAEDQAAAREILIDLGCAPSQP